MQSRGTRGQSETLGVVLILGMTVLSVTALAAFGGLAIDDTRQSVDVQSAEHALSQLDSRASLVGLSDADRQSVALGRGRQGTYSVKPDAGHITITHVNYTADEDLELYDAPLGTVEYASGDTVLAYQGGGVWRSQDGAGSVMVSSPEFHYRGLTLTLPILRMKGNSSVSGNARADLSSPDPSVPIYPNASDSYPNASRNFTNPVENGNVRVEVESAYYDAWADYFRKRTDGQVTTDPDNQTATLELVSTGAYGHFGLPMDGQPMELRALGNEHPLNAFSITLADDEMDNADFTNLDWSLYAQDGNQQFEIHLEGTGKHDGDPVEATIYYSNETAYQGWHSNDAFEVTVDGDGERYITANLTGNTTVEYADVKTTGRLIQYNSPSGDFASSVTFDEHTVDGNETYSTGQGAEMGYVVNHYVGLLGPNANLVVMDGKNQGSGNSAAGAIFEEESTGYLDVDGSGKYVTYLHVSENNVTVDLR